MSPIIQHHLNPLHIYCRLRDIGIPKHEACAIGCWYEHVIFKHMIIPLWFKIRLIFGNFWPLLVRKSSRLKVISKKS